MAEIIAELTAEITKEVEQKLQPLTNKVERFLRKLRNPAQASFDLGCELIRRGLYQEAMYRFKFTLWRQPARASAWYNLAICHFAQYQPGQGVAAVKRSLELNPKNEAALYLLATLQEGKYAEGHQPHTTPVEIIKSEFAARAANFEAEELGGWGYSGHFSLYEVLLEVMPQGCETLLDAGCGTGLLGDFVRPVCRKLVGIDLSKPMLAKARARKDIKGKPLYHQLLEGDLRAHLLHQSAPLYHCIASANVAPLLGGLAPMLEGAARALHPGGWLMFTALPLEAAEGYQLLTHVRRFAHSEAYLRQVAQKSGLILHRLERKPLYTGRDGWVVVLQKHA